MAPCTQDHNAQSAVPAAEYGRLGCDTTHVLRYCGVHILEAFARRVVSELEREAHLAGGVVDTDGSAVLVLSSSFSSWGSTTLVSVSMMETQISISTPRTSHCVVTKEGRALINTLIITISVKPRGSFRMIFAGQKCVYR